MLLEAEAELQVAVDELRELAHGLPPSLLRNLGLANAVRAVALQASVPTVALELGIPRLDDVAEATAFYVVSAAIANAQRYSHATSISIRGSFGAGRLRIEITDDGDGGAVATPGSGLEGLEERVDALGGTFTLESPLGRGTRVEATIPARLR
jgi:signal transduction histidine kinase